MAALVAPGQTTDLCDQKRASTGCGVGSRNYILVSACPQNHLPPQIWWLSGTQWHSVAFSCLTALDLVAWIATQILHNRIGMKPYELAFVVCFLAIKFSPSHIYPQVEAVAGTAAARKEVRPRKTIRKWSMDGPFDWWVIDGFLNDSIVCQLSKKNQSKNPKSNGLCNGLPVVSWWTFAIFGMWGELGRRLVKDCRKSANVRDEGVWQNVEVAHCRQKNQISSSSIWEDRPNRALQLMDKHG